MAEVARINEKAAKNYDELAAVFAPYGGIDGWLSSVCEDLIAVSYTHLDVYKRQASGIGQSL